MFFLVRLCLVETSEMIEYIGSKSAAEVMSKWYFEVRTRNVSNTTSVYLKLFLARFAFNHFQKSNGFLLYDQ